LPHEDEIGTILVRSRKDIGLAEESKQGVGVSSCCMSSGLSVEYQGMELMGATGVHHATNDRKFVKVRVVRKVKPRK
jgi:hypothetical protein